MSDERIKQISERLEARYSPAGLGARDTMLADIAYLLTYRRRRVERAKKIAGQAVRVVIAVVALTVGAVLLAVQAFG